jgi:hypothetical protein
MTTHELTKKSNAKRQGPSFRGYSRGIRKRTWVDPNGNLFRFGYRQDDGSISLIYASRKIRCDANNINMPSHEAEEIIRNVEMREEEAEVQRKKTERMDALYRPGGIGYLFTKASTKVGKGTQHHQ